MIVGKPPAAHFNMPMDCKSALLGALVGDALAMPVHWYYDRRALERDYGTVSTFMAPKSPHPDSILWRSNYQPLNQKGDILREQARYWGQRGIHYHQFLRAGENTLNFQLAYRLYVLVKDRGSYNPDVWLDAYMDFMLSPGNHRDTYVEEYHRGFFTKLSRGLAPRECSIEDVHIGGLASVPALFSALDLPSDELMDLIEKHVALTHKQDDVLRAARTLAKLLSAVMGGAPLRHAISEQAADWVNPHQLKDWCRQPDQVVVGNYLSPACYIEDAFPAALYLAWKYEDDFDGGIIANAQVGGDSCHRAAVVGSLLGLARGVSAHWLSGLRITAESKNQLLRDQAGSREHA